MAIHELTLPELVLEMGKCQDDEQRQKEQMDIMMYYFGSKVYKLLNILDTLAMDMMEMDMGEIERQEIFHTLEIMKSFVTMMEMSEILEMLEIPEMVKILKLLEMDMREILDTSVILKILEMLKKSN
jgi:hypothetical protein